MTHTGTQTITTSRLILRAFVPSDAPLMYKNWASDLRVTKYLQWDPHESADVSRAVLEDWIASYADPGFYQWAIVPKELGEPIGTISVVGKNDATNMLHVGYCIGYGWWHRGIVSEALRAVINYLFENTGAQRIEAQHDPENPHSGDVMKKCGMKYEGILRKYFLSNHGLVDACYHSVLREEWEASENRS